jgi:uncharacterized protein (DUF4415 family)
VHDRLTNMPSAGHFLDELQVLHAVSSHIVHARAMYSCTSQTSLQNEHVENSLVAQLLERNVVPAMQRLGQGWQVRVS